MRTELQPRRKFRNEQKSAVTLEWPGTQIWIQQWCLLGGLPCEISVILRKREFTENPSIFLEVWCIIISGGHFP